LEELMPENKERDYSDREEEEEHRNLARDVFGIDLDDTAEVASQANLIGIRSGPILLSRRIDSRTFFLQDERFGVGREAGVFEGDDAELLDASRSILDRLGIPSEEIAETAIAREMMQDGEVDRETMTIRKGEIREGKRMARLGRSVDDRPVWSSYLMLGLSKERRLGYLELHWPELPRHLVHEAHRLHYRVRSGWQAPGVAGADVESIEAGLLHSPAVSFFMDIHPALRVIYRPIEGLRGQKPVYYLDRHGNPVPIPREILNELPLQAPRAPVEETAS
jgi:hypothetical protein